METDWNLAYTYMGRPPDIARLPWLVDRELPYYMGMLTPSGPNGVTVASTEIGGRMNVSVSFNDNVIKRSEIEALVDLMCTEPVSLLGISAGHSPSRTVRPRLAVAS